MTSEQVIVTAAVALATAFMARLTWRRYFRKKGARPTGCGRSDGDGGAKHVSLTMDGKTVRR